MSEINTYGELPWIPYSYSGFPDIHGYNCLSSQEYCLSYRLEYPINRLSRELSHDYLTALSPHINSHPRLTVTMISKRIESNLTPSPLFEYMSKAISNAYHETTNPNGIISLGIAENTLLSTELSDFLSTNIKITPNLFGYGGCSGPPSLIPGLLNLYNNPPFNPAVPVTKEHIYFTAGCTALLDQMFWTLCDEGDGVLIGKPSYGGFITDMTARSKLVPIHVSLKGLDPFSKDAVTRYEDEYLSAQKRGINVKVLVVCNPHNPLGQYFLIPLSI
jgi:aspartate/methionine/tyrosine aminotransferase